MRKLTLFIATLFLSVGMAWGANGDVLSLENGWYTFKANNSSGYAQYNGERIIIKAAYPLITEEDIAFYVTNGEDGKVTIQTADGKYVTYKGTGTGDQVEIVDATKANDGNKWWKIQEGKADNLRTIVPSTGATNGWNFAVYYNGANGALGFWDADDNGSQWIIAQSVKVFAGKAKIKCHQSYLKWDNRADGIIQKAASAEDATIFTISQNADGYFAFQTPDGKFVTYDGSNNVTVANSSDGKWWKITANGGSGQGVDIFPSALTPGGGTNALNWSKDISGVNTGLGTWRADDNNSYCSIEMLPVAKIGETSYYTLAEAAAAANAGDEIKLLANIDGDITVPSGITLNGNGFAISGGILAEGDITFAGLTTAADFDAKVVNTAVNIPAGASLQLTGSARLVIGHGATFNITGTIENAKTADKATLVPSLKIAAGASITGNGVTFNVNNAYIVAEKYCSSKNSNANGTFNFNINNSIWDQTGNLQFSVPTNGMDPTVNFSLANSVLTTTGHVVFSVTKGEIVIDNSLVNQGASRQLENRSTMTIKNGSVVYATVNTNENSINSGTIVVDNATYMAKGNLTGATVGTGNLVIKKDANIVVDGSITNANITIDATDMAAGDVVNLTANLANLAGTLSVINNDKLEASIVDGKVVLAAKPVAKIGELGYATLEAAFAAATEGQTITLLADATPALTSQRAITKAAVIDLGGKTMTLTEDDLYFGTTTFMNGTIVVDPSVNASTAVFWMFANQTLTFDKVKVVATGVTGTYLIGLDGNNSDLNLLNGSEILVENTTALDLDIICVNASTGNDIKVENSKVNVTNLDGRVFFRGNYTVKDSEVNLAGITKAGFRIEAGQTLSIEGTSEVNIEGEPRDGGIHLTDLTATYTKAETATVNATVNEPKVAKVGENTYRTLAQAVAAVEDGGTITLIANETFTKNNRYNNGGYWDGLGYSGDKSFTIDLGGFTIGQNGALNDYLMWFKNDGAKANTITLMNGTLDAGTTAYCALATASSNAQKITVNLENIKVINNNSNGATLKIRAGAELNVKAGTEITGKDSYLGIECWAATVNIYDGAKFYMNGTSSYNGCLAGVSGNGTINVYGGEGLGKSGGFIAMTSGGTINIEGGEWTANTDGTYANGNKSVLVAQSENGAKSIVNVTGGTFKGGYNCYGAAVGDAQINISGGNFNAAPTSYVAEDYIAVENNGVWTVVKAAAKIGDVCYETALKALKNAKDNETVTFLAGTHILGDLTHVHFRANGDKSPKNLTIQGEEGKTVVVDKFYFNTNAFPENLTIKNITIDGNESGAQQGISSHTTVTGLTVENCTFKNGAFISLADQLATNVTVKNNSFDGTGVDKSTAVYVQKANGLTVTGNTITGGFYNAVQCSSEAADIAIDGNTINGTNDRALRFGTVKGAVAITNNQFSNATDDANELLKATKVDGGSIAFTGNTYDGNPWNPATINSGDNVVAAVLFVATVNGVKYATLAEAIAASTPETGWGGEVTLLKDITLEGGYADADEGLRIEKSVTINGAGHTIDCGIFTKGIRIYQNGDLASNVMFKNVNIVNNNYQGRCIDTRSGKINLMLNGGVNLTAHGTNSQPLTIGGSETMTKVTISGGTIDAGTSGYGVICFVPVTNNITVQSNAVIKGLAAFYLKEGVTNTSIKLTQATIIGTNKYAAASGDFGAIVIEGSKNGVRLEHSDAVVKAVAADGAEMAAQAAFLLRGNNNTVGYYNNANAKVVTEGGQAYWTLSDADVTGTKYERNGVEMLLEAETRGYQFITIEDALRYAKNGDTVKLLANAELDETYVNEKSLTLDLNGKTLSTAYVAGSTTNHLYAIDNKGTLKITGNGTINARGIFNYGAMTLENGTINAIDGNGGYGVRNYAGATFTMNGGTIATTLEDDNKVDKGGYDATTVRVDEDATFTMNGGELNNICDYTFAIDNHGTTTVKGGKATSVHTTVANYGTINIEGGEFVCNGLEGITAHAVWAAEGTTNISGGTFDGKDNYNGFNVCAEAGANVEIKGGEFLNVHSGSLYGQGTITVSAGTFFDKIDDARCVVGFQAVANENGTYTVKETGCRNAMTIVDGEYTEFVNEKDITVGTLTYRRELGDDDLDWNALYVPFEIPVEELTALGLEVAYLNDVRSYDEDFNGEIERMAMEVIILRSGVLNANHPYLFRRTSASSVVNMEIVLTGTTLYSTEEESKQTTVTCSSAYMNFAIGGTYKEISTDEIDGRYVLGVDEEGKTAWGQLEGPWPLGAFRLHLTLEAKNGSPVKVSESAMKAIRIRTSGEQLEDGSTVIYDVEMDGEQSVDYIFDLQGRRVLEPQKGNLYIINGKKVVIK